MHICTNTLKSTIPFSSYNYWETLKAGIISIELKGRTELRSTSAITRVTVYKLSNLFR